MPWTRLCSAAKTARIQTLNSAVVRSRDNCQDVIASFLAGSALAQQEDLMSRPRPKYLNLFQIRLPLPGIVSIMHRMSGALLFLLIPLLLYLLQGSLESPRAYAALKSALAHPVAKLVAIGVAWAYFHHLCAGVRYLALDLDYGTDLPRARASAWAVLAVSLALTLAFGVLTW